MMTSTTTFSQNLVATECHHHRPSNHHKFRRKSTTTTPSRTKNFKQLHRLAFASCLLVLLVNLSLPFCCHASIASEPSDISQSLNNNGAISSSSESSSDASLLTSSHSHPDASALEDESEALEPETALSPVAGHVEAAPPAVPYEEEPKSPTSSQTFTFTKPDSHLRIDVGEIWPISKSRQLKFEFK